MTDQSPCGAWHAAAGLFERPGRSMKIDDIEEEDMELYDIIVIYKD